MGSDRLAWPQAGGPGRSNPISVTFASSSFTVASDSGPSVGCSSMVRPEVCNVLQRRRHGRTARSRLRNAVRAGFDRPSDALRSDTSRVVPEDLARSGDKGTVQPCVGCSRGRQRSDPTPAIARSKHRMAGRI